MRGHTKESGFALIMLIGIIAALAILAATLVMMLDNQQHATAKSRETKTSLYFAEAGLSSAANAVEATNTWLTTAYTDSSSTTGMNQGYSTIAGAPTVTYLVYDNASPVNTAVHYDANGDGEVWVEADTTYLGRTTRVRELVSSSTKTSILPKAAAWTDTNMTLTGSSNIYGVNNDNTPDDSGAPYVTTVMVGGSFTGTSATTLAYPGHSVQSLGLQINKGAPSGVPGTVTYTSGGVGLLSDYFDQAHQAALMTEAQAAITGKSTLFNSAGTSVSTGTTPYTTWTQTTSTTWTAPASTDYVVPSGCNSGNLTIGAASGKTSTYTFNRLWVAGNLTISGNTTVNTTGLYVGGNLTITGTSAASVTDSLGPLYVAGKILWEGAFNSNATTLSVTTATTPSGTPGPMFAKIISIDGNMNTGTGDNGSYDSTNKPGPTNITLGATWIDGDAGTGDVAVNFSGPTSTASTVMCTLLATTEQTHSNGLVNFGSLLHPMIYFMQCDNDGLYSNEGQWLGTGTYCGLMIAFEAEMQITSGTVLGAVLEGCPYKSGSDTGTDLTLTNATICYNQAVIDNCTSDNLRTTTTGVVPGSWQQLETD
jgi:hypothetical protein